ncbi:hypothetical protein DL98DRAFT_376870, partial [Cadophora sp. DSE1049]
QYVVIGLFSKVNGVPSERLIKIKEASGLFRSMWWAIVSLRGVGGVFSLKDIKGFGIYKCHPYIPLHTRLAIDATSSRTLTDFFHAYKSYSRPDNVNEEWVSWLTHLNNDSSNPVEGDMLSLEIILGWSVPRISIVVLTPVLLSFAIGMWLNSKDWSDATTIQTAWSVASYIATAGA